MIVIADPNSPIKAGNFLEELEALELRFAELSLMSESEVNEFTIVEIGAVERALDGYYKQMDDGAWRYG